MSEFFWGGKMVMGNCELGFCGGVGIVPSPPGADPPLTKKRRRVYRNWITRSFATSYMKFKIFLSLD